MSLNSPAITELTTESGTFRLVNEWLAKWFDGGMHAISPVQTSVIPWPKANRAFGQGPAVQPLHNWENGTDAEIRLVMHPRVEQAMLNDTTLYQGKLVTDYVILNFWVSAKKPGSGQSELLAQIIAQQLKALLTNPDSRYELAERGICHLQVQGPPQPMPNTDYAKRLVSCNAQLMYPVQYGRGMVVSVPPPGTTLGGTQTMDFMRENPLLTGDYLLGYYRWSVPVQVASVLVIAWAPQGQDVVLGLEVNGQQSGITVTIPQGEPDVEVTAGPDDPAALADLVIPPGQAVRWQVLSAPDGEGTAWHCTVAMGVGEL